MVAALIAISQAAVSQETQVPFVIQYPQLFEQLVSTSNVSLQDFIFTQLSSAGLGKLRPDWTRVPLNDAKRTSEYFERQLSDKNRAVVLASDEALDIAKTRELLGASGPHSNIAPAFKRENPRRKDEYVWLGIGWIPWISLGDLRKRGGCRAGTWQDICAEQTGSNSYLIKHTVSAGQWPVFGIGLNLRSALKTSVRYEIAKLQDSIASRRFSEEMAQHFVIVPHNDVRRQRSVTFELYEGDTSKLIASTGGISDPLPARDTVSSSSARTVCGKASAACPPYKVTPELERKTLELRKRVRQ